VFSDPLDSAQGRLGGKKILPLKKDSAWVKLGAGKKISIVTPVYKEQLFEKVGAKDYFQYTANHLDLAIFRACLAETRQHLPLRFIIAYWPSNAFFCNSSRTACLRHLPASIAILLGRFVII
jgi:hypothetical protein